jgi:S-adenosylmethionine:tRNA ribosyltransferase-isomerase
VLNTSATLPAAIDAQLPDGSATVVHVSAALSASDWVVEIRRTDATGPDPTSGTGDVIRLPEGRRLVLGDGYPDPTEARPRLHHARLEPPTLAEPYLARVGRPIGYRYLRDRFPLQAYQTVYATWPGSAEMPSAGRPFSEKLLVRLMARGVTVAPVVLHAGVSSPEAGEPPLPERFEVPPDTARLVNSAREARRRVVAVGTTVVRALESAAEPDGTVRPRQGWTELVLRPGRPARAVTGLISGLHAPEASHLLLLEAVAGTVLVRDAYAAAVQRRYLWHEFGDSTLFLPPVS